MLTSLSRPSARFTAGAARRALSSVASKAKVAALFVAFVFCPLVLP